ncbi:MAG: type IV pilus twitching motility protein PilT [Clostridiaceae bacterium]|nr:type IV pilus twitching motility protein PilT [Clostridiaceae bacterium]
MQDVRLKGRQKIEIMELFEKTVQMNATDLHLVAGCPPAVRIAGDITMMEYPALRPRDVEGLLLPLLNEKQRKQLEDNLELDFTYAIESLARFRGNIMFQRGTYSAAFRVVPFIVPEYDSLGLIPEIKDLCNLSKGLILVTGSAGSGKSTTLAALINIMNKTQKLNIITIEDPIEFLHRHNKSMVRQREVGLDTHSFANALRNVLRHDPDVIMIGEMRDQESISIAITAAETGHLVLSTMHTQTAPLTVSRIVDIFTTEKREQVRQQLANSIQAIIFQQLVPAIGNKSRVLAVEYMVATPAIRNIIREGKYHQLYGMIQTGQAYGMQTMDQALTKLHNSGKISRETVLEYCVDKREAERLILRSGV